MPFIKRVELLFPSGTLGLERESTIKIDGPGFLRITPAEEHGSPRWRLEFHQEVPVMREHDDVEPCSCCGVYHMVAK